MIRYLSVDLETTGLDCAIHQVIEMGAIYDDGQQEIKNLPKFHVYVRHGTYIWDPQALKMNWDLTAMILAETVQPILDFEEVIPRFKRWLEEIGLGGKKLVFAGKNFGSFDLGFLKMLPGWVGVKYYHRYLDPSMYYIEEADEAPPGLELCAHRIGLTAGSHRALD